jgi:hypothetical protein
VNPFLTIPETCVWAATLDPEMVARVSNSGDPEAVHFFLEDALPPLPCGAHVSVWRARCSQQALARLPVLCSMVGGISMTGIPLDSGDRESIPATAWADLKIGSQSDQRGFTAAAFHNPRARWWAKLRISVADVQRIWPPMELPSGSALRRLPTADEMKVWYSERVAKHNPSQPSPSRTADEKAARDHFRAIGRRTGDALKDMVRAARAEYAPSDWTGSGPKGRKAHAHAQRANLA